MEGLYTEGCDHGYVDELTHDEWHETRHSGQESQDDHHRNLQSGGGDGVRRGIRYRCQDGHDEDEQEVPEEHRLEVGVDGECVVVGHRVLAAEQLHESVREFAVPR